MPVWLIPIIEALVSGLITAATAHGTGANLNGVIAAGALGFATKLAPTRLTPTA